MKKILMHLFILFSFSACHQKQRADIIFYNGMIYTVDKDFTVAEALAISDGKIIATGNSKAILAEYVSKEKIDLEGKPAFPGFIDAHCHFYQYATDKQKAALFGTLSYDDVIKRVVEFSKGNKFSWILGRGWDQNDWTVKEFPSKEILDSLFPHTPVFLQRVDGHAVLCNQEALNLSQINVSTKIAGGEVKVKNGKLTGILIDNAVDLVRNNIPAFTEEILTNCLQQAEQDCFAAGLTTVDDAGLGKDSIDLVMKLQNNGQLKIRTYVMVSATDENKKYYFDHGPVKTDRMNVRSFKVYGDGSLGSRGACLLQPYSDEPGNTGFLLTNKNSQESFAAEMIEHGFQLCTHAIGDSANRLALNIYAEHLKGHNDKRWRIEHCQVVDNIDLKRFGENNVIASVQPTHATSDMYWAQERIGTDRVKTAYAYNDLLKNANGMIAFGTDFPVENISPIYTFYAAVARKDLKGFPENGFQTENKIERQHALRAMTIWAAFANFEENEKGSLEKGKFADLVVLDKDIMHVNESEIPKTRVMMTVVNGEKVFEVKK